MSFGVTVIIPTYQRASLLTETIEATLAQTAPPLEVVVVDDGSTDDTAQVCARFGARVRYHLAPHAGVQAARNIGASLATGAWLAFCDDDDLWRPDHLERIARLIMAEPSVNFVFTNFTVFGEGVGTISTMFDMAPPGFWTLDKKQIDSDSWVIAQPLIDNILQFQPIWPSGLQFLAISFGVSADTIRR